MIADEHVLNHLVYVCRIKERFESEEWTSQGVVAAVPLFRE
jgi:hypothetical protein